MFFSQRIFRILFIAFVAVTISFGVSFHFAAAETISVTTTADEFDNLIGNGDCSLREAIWAANNNQAIDSCPAGNDLDPVGSTTGDLVEFPSGPHSSFISIGIGDDLGEIGDLDVSSNIAFYGDSISNTIVGSLNSNDRVFDIRTASTVVFQNMTITGGDAGGADGGALRIPVGATVSIANAQFTSNEGAFGAAIANYGALTLNNVDFVNNVASSLGGGIYCMGNGSTLVVNGTNSYSGNQAVSGGAMVIESCTATINSGSTFSGNSASEMDFAGGAIFSDNSSLTVNSATFTGNDAPNGNGGAINSTFSTLTIDGGSVFSNNTAGVAGGALSLNQSNTHLNNSSIDSSVAPNTAVNGGGIRVIGGSLVMQNGTIITGNQASNAGGGVFMGSNANVTLDGANIDGSIGPNTALNGAGVYINGGTSTLNVNNDAVIAGNQAGNFGGGIYSDGTVIFDAANLGTSNEATNGAGIYNGGSATFQNGSTISGNEASADGGGIYNLATGTVLIDSSFVDDSFSANTAVRGGGIFNSGGSVTLQNGSTVNGNDLNSTSAQYGAGIFNRAAGVVTIDASEVSHNGCIGSGTCTGIGISNITEGILTITDSTLANNDAPSVGTGGALYNTNASATIINSTLSGNDVAYGGAAIFNEYNTSSTTLTLTNVNISGNNATSDSAGVLNYGGAVVINNSTISGNSTSTALAAALGHFYIAGGANSMTIQNGTISGNSATNSGSAALYVDANTTFVGDSLTIANNTSTIEAIVNDGSLTLRNSIIDNAATSTANCGGTGTFTSNGYNLDTDGTCMTGGTGDITGPSGINPTLALNDGITLTHAITESSAAYNAGSTDLTVDQRSIARGQAGADDIGAFELTSASTTTPTVTTTTSSGGSSNSSGGNENFWDQFNNSSTPTELAASDELCGDFPDVAADDPDCDAILFVRDLGAMTGHDSGLFEPEGLLQRDQIAKISLMSFGLFDESEDYCDQVNPFPDVTLAEQWSAQYVCRGVDLDMITGYEGGDDAGFFRPARLVNLVEFWALILRNVDEVMTAGTSYTGFAPDAWYSPFAAFVADNNLHDTSLNSAPTDSVKRRAVARFLFQLNELGLLPSA